MPSAAAKGAQDDNQCYRLGLRSASLHHEEAAGKLNFQG